MKLTASERDGKRCLGAVVGDNVVDLPAIDSRVHSMVRRAEQCVRNGK
jgi:hypothetical protein